MNPVSSSARSSLTKRRKSLLLFCAIAVVGIVTVVAVDSSSVADSSATSKNSLQCSNLEPSSAGACQAPPREMREEEGERQQRVTSNGDQDRNDDKGDEGLEGDDGTEEDGRMVYESDDASADTWEIDEDVEELDENERFTRGGDLGVVQEWDDRDRENTGEQAVLAKIALDREYRRNFLADSSQKRWHDKCRNRHELCTAWALEGECGRNFAFMKTGCPVACRSCDWLDVEERCRPDPDESDSLIPGDLDRLFERIASDPEIQRRFQPVVLSRPSYALGDDAESASYQIGMWLVLLKTFLSEEEARRMVGLTERSGLQPSEGGEVSRDGDYISSVSDYRTSWNTFCTGKCLEDPTHADMVSRAELLLGMNQTNFEYTQLLRYREAQYYQRHNDFITTHLNMSMGPRVLTLFVYLSEVEEGGGTDFPELNVTVEAKPGRAVLWPSVYSDQPRTNDPRSDHEALPVKKGLKYGANIWVHQRNYKAAYDKACG